MLPLISCLCPTYKRPRCLANAIACFLNQDYPADRRELIVFDDAGQYEPMWSSRYRIISRKEKVETLPEKMDFLVGQSQGDIIAIWEDDDVYLPWHLQNIADTYAAGGEYMVYKDVYSNYQRPKDGSVIVEPAAGRFHASWAFTKELYRLVGGYPKTARLDFDQQMRERLKIGTVKEHEGRIGFVYRWGNGVYHGSQLGEDGYQQLLQQIKDQAATYIGNIRPEFDQETEKIWRGVVVHASN